MRPIDADELLEYFADAPDMSFENYHTPISTLRQLITDMPTIDAVPVVRCKECKHGVMYYPEKEIGKEAEPRWYCALHSSSCRPDDYCSYGERKDDGLH